MISIPSEDFSYFFFYVKPYNIYLHTFSVPTLYWRCKSQNKIKIKKNSFSNQAKKNLKMFSWKTIWIFRLSKNTTVCWSWPYLENIRDWNLRWIYVVHHQAPRYIDMVHHQATMFIDMVYHQAPWYIDMVHHIYLCTYMHAKKCIFS